MKKSLIYGADFETDGAPEERRIVQWAVWSQIEEKHGRDLKGFMDWLHTLIRDGRKPKKSARVKTFSIYFHNLPYDASYLREALSDYCQTWNMDLTLIAPDAREIFIKILPTEESKKMGLDGTVTFYDSSKKIPAKLAKIGEMIGFEKLEEVSGNSFDYGWSENIDFGDPENWRYVCRDAEICGRAMLEMASRGLDRPTISSCALAMAKEICGKYMEEEWKTLGYGPYKGDGGFRKWHDLFPTFDYDTDMRLRKAYIGGVNFSAPGIYKNCIHIDVNSMYPTVMTFDDMPFGDVDICSLEEAKCSGCPYIVDGLFMLNLRDGGIPFFHFKNALDSVIEGIEPTQPVTECRSWHSMALTNVDIETLEKEYSVEMFPETVYIFRDHAKGLLKPYIDRWKVEKIRCTKEGDRIGRELAKLLMNSLYGKMSQGYKGDKYVYKMDKNGIWGISHTEAKREDFIRMNKKEKQRAMCGYIPYGLFVTAHARRRLLEMGHAVREAGGILVHADTDSWIFQGTKEMLPKDLIDWEHSGDFGLWDLEHEQVDMIYEGGYKRYVMVCGDKKIVKCAGVPDNMKVELMDNPKLIFGAVLGHEQYISNDGTISDTRKLMPKMVRGGKDLVRSTYDLSKPIGIYLKAGGAKI